ncbi:MAG TPA: hypothetical protein PKY29_04535 [Ferruginibacter sp.]|nr:hypothetical protein [Ferruginibacter sp.]HRQ20556.1 hypothetical protein [Ferruginibacter sp.]
MQYLIMVETGTKTKNCLQDRITAELLEFNRFMLPDSHSKEKAKEKIFNLIKELNAHYKKCKPVSVSYWHPNIHSIGIKRHDEYMSLDGENFVYFKIFAVKN